MSIAAALANRRLVVVAGTGGVGKTTVSAALGVALAQRGRHACVLTVDPARRLATALGLTSDVDVAEVRGAWPGTLHAVQLDAGQTFDGLLSRYGARDDVVEAMRANPIYQSLAGALGATQEYMAVERVHELLNLDQFDVIVIDTPPTRNAVDLLDAPQRLIKFLRHPVVRTLTAPARVSVRAASLAAAAVTRTIGSVVGTDLVKDVVSFFQAFGDLRDGFAERASAIDALLHAPDTGYLLVTTTRGDAISEARWFSAQLRTRDLRADGVVVNQIHPALFHGDPERAPLAGGVLGAHLDNYRAMARAARRDRAALAVLTGDDPELLVAEIPLAPSSINDVDALDAIARTCL